jgi:hypothetical protein
MASSGGNSGIGNAAAFVESPRAHQFLLQNISQTIRSGSFVPTADHAAEIPADPFGFAANTGTTAAAHDVRSAARAGNVRAWAPSPGPVNRAAAVKNERSGRSQTRIVWSSKGPPAAGPSPPVAVVTEHVDRALVPENL